MPTEIRIRKWALSFEDLLQDETGRNEFEQFLKKEYSQENIRFYKACKELIGCPQSQVSRWKADIEKYVYIPVLAFPCTFKLVFSYISSLLSNNRRKSCLGSLSSASSI